MPEGDTIWRSAATLREHLAGRSLKGAQPQALQVLRGRALEAVEPVGKHLLMRFSGGWTLHSHMRTSGSWHLYRPGERWRRPRHYARAVLEFEDWTAVCFSAPVLQVVRNEAPAVGHLGPDILAEEFPPEVVLARARAAGPLALGELLLDQRVCCGIGNVYKCEALWQRRLDPWRSSAGLEDKELRELYEAARALMRPNLSGRAAPRRYPGSGREAVHGRRGRPCPRCGTLIQSRPQGEQGRWTYWCPGCQG